MPIERLRMRPWLEKIIDNNTYPGVEWLDKHEKIFRLPWKHASRNGWTLNSDASLFRAWAEHTGKLKETPNPKIWKANFRCALNSLPDMEEMREKRLTKGNNAFKVYRILDKTVERKKSVTKRSKGRYQRKKRPYSRSTDISKDDAKKENRFKDTSMPISSSDVELLEPIEIIAGLNFPVPQPCHKLHLMDHDYAVTRYFDLFEEADTMKDFGKLNFDTPDTTIIKTEPRSPMEEEDIEDHSFYEDDNNNSQKLEYCNSRKSGDDKVMSDDEVVELIDELSSDCGSLDTAMPDEFPDGCIDRLNEDFDLSKPRSHSAPASLEEEFLDLDLLQPTTLPRSKSTPDIQTMLKTTPQELLQSCL